MYTRPFIANANYNEEHQYWTQYVPSEHAFREYVDRTIMQRSDFDPRGYNPDTRGQYWPTPWQASYFGETRFRENDMPGTSGAQTRFADLQSHGYLGSWGDAPDMFRENGTQDYSQSPVATNQYANDGRFAETSIAHGTSAGTQFSIWTIQPQPY